MSSDFKFQVNVCYTFWSVVVFTSKIDGKLFFIKVWWMHPSIKKKKFICALIFMLKLALPVTLLLMLLRPSAPKFFTNENTVTNEYILKITNCYVNINAQCLLPAFSLVWGISSLLHQLPSHLQIQTRFNY